MSTTVQKVNLLHLYAANIYAEIPFLYVEQVCKRASPLLMNSGSFVLDCQPIRRITAGYERVIIMSLQGRVKLSPSVF